MEDAAKILIVDDDINVLKAYRRIFLETSYQIRYESSGEAAIEAAARFAPNIVLLDVMMPGVNGFDICGRLKSLEALGETEVVFISAKRDLSDKLDGYRRGGSDYLVKPFDPEELLAKIAVILARKQRHLEETTIDPLTGVGNRKVFEERLNRYFQLAERYHRKLSLGIIDADHFKRINDTFGHPAGDAVLRELAARVQDNIRESDTLTRIGGEEFAVIMPEIGKRRAVEIMERIRRAVASAPFDFSTEDHNTSVTVSIGIAGFPDDASSPDALYGQSDKALYRAKENGRNRIESAGESIPRQLSR